MPGAQPRRERLAVHARQLALEPGVRLLHRPCRPLLRGLEQAHRAALDHHVHRTPRLGQWVLISGTWYKPPIKVSRAPWHLFGSRISLDARASSALVTTTKRALALKVALA